MPRNLADMATQFVEIEEIDIAEWHPQRDGEGHPTQVHYMYKVKGLDGITFVMRFKGPDTLSQIINALTEHGLNVFGDGLRHKLTPRREH